MKKLNESFKTELWQTIEDIENNSLVEIILIAKQRSGNYIDVALWGGIIFNLLIFTLLMFLPIVFGDYLIYLGPIVAFATAYSLIYFINPLNRKLIGKKRLARNVEIMARAIFQKGGIRHTNNKIGVLFYISFLEKMVYILPDKGAELMVPKEDWENIEQRFNSIFDKPDYDKAIIKELQRCKSIFNQHIPPIENDINELPDDLEINF